MFHATVMHLCYYNYILCIVYVYTCPMQPNSNQSDPEFGATEKLLENDDTDSPSKCDPSRGVCVLYIELSNTARISKIYLIIH